MVERGLENKDETKAEQKSDQQLPDSPDGFARFYELIYERRLPRHGLRWVRALYAARKAGKGLIVEAFRGSSKTTTLTIAFTAFRIGNKPHKSNLLIQAGDKAASDTAQQIGDLIEHNYGWRQAFPDVRPDKEVAWGDNGFEVQRSGGDYDAWRAECAREKGKDPTFVGLGYRSAAIIGKHPTGMLVVDDIHDENNTRSARELETVVKILTGTILPTATPKTWMLFVGTPWRYNDALAQMKSTGEFKFMRTPVKKTKPTWRAKFPQKEINKIRKMTGEAEYARMYLLDLKAAQGIHLKAEWLHPYPHEKVQLNWPVVMGIDYASTSDEVMDSKRDYFALAIGRVIPGGGLVMDGFRAQLSQGEAEQQVKAFYGLYPNTQVIGVETAGKGEEFYYLLHRSVGLPVVPMHPGGKSKAHRFEAGMAPKFQYAQAWVADVETPFLRSFRDEWLRWPYGGHDDTLDAVYWMLMASMHQLAGATVREKRENPISSLGRK
jgi:hypothetical protein